MIFALPISSSAAAMFFCRFFSLDTLSDDDDGDGNFEAAEEEIAKAKIMDTDAVDVPI